MTFRSVVMGCQEIKSGDARVVVAGGQESMSASRHAIHMRNGTKVASMYKACKKFLGKTAQSPPLTLDHEVSGLKFWAPCEHVLPRHESFHSTLGQKSAGKFVLFVPRRFEHAICM